MPLLKKVTAIASMWAERRDRLHIKRLSGPSAKRAPSAINTTPVTASVTTRNSSASRDDADDQRVEDASHVNPIARKIAASSADIAAGSLLFRDELRQQRREEHCELGVQEVRHEAPAPERRPQSLGSSTLASRRP